MSPARVRSWRRSGLATTWLRSPGPKPIVSHTAFELLVDPQGRERVLWDAQVQASDIARDLKVLG